MKHRRFDLVRATDITGVSGVGLVAEGVEFCDGSVVLRWRGEFASTVVWGSLEDAMRVHGHAGNTQAVFLD